MPRTSGVAALIAQQRRSTSSNSAAISGREIDAHLRFLSHDPLQGLAPARPGEGLAAQSIVP